LNIRNIVLEGLQKRDAHERKAYGGRLVEVPLTAWRVTFTY
jgi:hypothetical protein